MLRFVPILFLVCSLRAAVVDPREGEVSENLVPYALASTWNGNAFYDAFNFFTGNDPTHGYVDFLTLAAARAINITFVNSRNQVYMGTDYTSVASGRGRRSLRTETKNSYNDGLIVLDLDHMPHGCGTWPAFWTCGPSWPNFGEIDIIEGVNEQQNDLSTLHTNNGCDQKAVATNQFTGHRGQFTNCDVVPTGNSGCGISSDKNIYGAAFNAMGGGLYVTEWDPSRHIKLWFFPHNQVPADLTRDNPDPDTWPTPYAYFHLGSDCPASHFSQHKIIFDLTFCGDWAGAVFGSQCPGKGSCNSYVQNNPSAFRDAYWLINSLKVYHKK